MMVSRSVHYRSRACSNILLFLVKSSVAPFQLPIIAIFVVNTVVDESATLFLVQRDVEAAIIVPRLGSFTKGRAMHDPPSKSNYYNSSPFCSEKHDGALLA
jgi:hypothetical protein